MKPETVSDLLVSAEEARARLQVRLDLISAVRLGNLDHVTWYDETMMELDAIFASKASFYFSDEGGFDFAYSSIKGRIFRSANIDRSYGILKRMIDGIGKASTTEVPGPKKSNSIFIVHGHDEKRLLEVKEVILSQGLKPVILKDEPNGGRTIIEKFETAADVGFAVILLTADDLGSMKTEEAKRLRARQNVILELGYFVGKLSRSRVCALSDSGVELPSDIHGVLYTPLDESGMWKYKLLDELKIAGYRVDKNKL